MNNPDAKVEYDLRKQFIEELKTLNKSDYEEMFRIIKLNNVEYSENSNGIFFDINHVDSSIFSLLVQCIERSKEQKRIDKERIAEIEALKKV